MILINSTGADATALLHANQTMDHLGPHHGSLALSQIFPFCVLMYGSVAAMWVCHSVCNKGLKVKGEVTNAYIALLCVTWCSFSVGMHVLNKGLAGSLEAPCLISIIQMVIAVLLIGGTSYRQFLEANREQMRTWLVVPMFFAGMLCSSFYTFEYISLSLLTVVRNLTPLVVLPIERSMMPADQQPQITNAMIMSILIMLAGTMVYTGGLKDLSIIGVSFAIANMFLASSDRLIQRRLLTQECKSLPSSVCVIINNSVGIIPCVLLAFATHEVHETLTPEHKAQWHDPRIMVLLLLSGCAGIGICYMGFECQRVISATSFFVMSNVAKIAVVACGVLFFGDPIKSPMAVAGLALSLGGSCLYSHTQLKAKQAPLKEKVDEEQAAEGVQSPSGKP